MNAAEKGGELSLAGTPTLPTLLSRAQVAERYRCSLAAAERIMRMAGAFAPGGELLVRADAIDAWEHAQAGRDIDEGTRRAEAACTLLSPQQAALHCGTSVRTIYRAIANSELAATRIGSRLRVASDEIDRFLAARVVRPRNADEARLVLTRRPARGEHGYVLRSLL